MPIPLPEENSAKDNTFMLFLRCLISSFQTQNIQNIVSSYSFTHYIWGYIYVLFLFCVVPGRGYVLHSHPNHHFSFPNYLFYLEIDLETVFEKPINHTTFRPKNPSQKSPRNCRFTTLGIETPHHSNIFRASFHSASNTKFQNCFFYRLCTSKLPMKSMVSLLFPGIIFLQFSSFIFATKKDYGFSP